MRIHYFDSTNEAYDRSQTGYFPPDTPFNPLRPDGGFIEVEDGDILVVKSESVVGIMVEAWPTSISHVNYGAFHLIENDSLWETMDEGKYFESWVLANEIYNKDIRNESEES